MTQNPVIHAQLIFLGIAAIGVCWISEEKGRTYKEAFVCNGLAVSDEILVIRIRNDQILRIIS